MSSPLLAPLRGSLECRASPSTSFRWWQGALAPSGLTTKMVARASEEVGSGCAENEPQHTEVAAGSRSSEEGACMRKSRLRFDKLTVLSNVEGEAAPTAREAYLNGDASHG